MIQFRLFVTVDAQCDTVALASQVIPRQGITGATSKPELHQVQVGAEGLAGGTSLNALANWFDAQPFVVRTELVRIGAPRGRGRVR